MTDRTVLRIACDAVEHGRKKRTFREALDAAVDYFFYHSDGERDSGTTAMTG
jgi:hypothetical protein